MTIRLATRQNVERAGKCRANLRSVRAVTRARADDPAAVKRATNQSRNKHENRSRGDATARSRGCCGGAPLALGDRGTATTVDRSLGSSSTPVLTLIAPSLEGIVLGPGPHSDFSSLEIIVLSPGPHSECSLVGRHRLESGPDPLASSPSVSPHPLSPSPFGRGGTSKDFRSASSMTASSCSRVTSRFRTRTTR